MSENTTRANIRDFLEEHDDEVVEALWKFLPGIVRTIKARQHDRIERAIDRATVEAAEAFDKRREDETRKLRESMGEGQP